MAEKSCVICGGDEGEGPLVEAPCGAHWVCHDDVSSFFERATDNESLFPPKCCGQIFLLHDYEQYVDFDTAWAYQVKEQGEYAVLAKFRIYCGNGACVKFLHPSTHVTDEATKITYAICEDPACGKMTCTGCRVLLHDGTKDHVCTKSDEEEKFKKIAQENGYQECTVCGATVELIEACNHVTCECGHDFCYICGVYWEGLHACPHYGKPEYDDEDYNQDGFHRDTGLNRNGFTRPQETAHRRGEDPNADEDDDEEGDIDWEVLQHLTPAQRAMINNLENVAREDALDQLRIELFEQQGITFGQDGLPRGPPRWQPHPFIQPMLQHLLDTFVARAPADEDGAAELIQDAVFEISSDLAAWAVQQLDRAFDAVENPGIGDEHMRALAQHFTGNRDILALGMDPELLARLGVHLAEQLVLQARRFEDGDGGGVAESPGILQDTTSDSDTSALAARDGSEEETGPSTPKNEDLGGNNAEGAKEGAGSVRSPPGAWPGEEELFTYTDELPEGFTYTDELPEEDAEFTYTDDIPEMW